MMTGCSSEEFITSNNDQTIFVINQHSDCKSFLKSSDYDDNVECFEYTYSQNTLNLVHINAAFNCCPEKIIADYTINNNVLVITETETEGLCNCLCLYDLTYEFENFLPGTYIIRFAPHYLTYNEETLEFEVTITENGSESYCKERNTYPWNIN